MSRAQSTSGGPPTRYSCFRDRSAIIMELHFVSGMSYNDIAGHLGITRSVVAGVINRNRTSADIAPRQQKILGNMP